MTATPCTIIFGGSGKVARHIIRLLTSDPGGDRAKHAVHAVIRRADQADDIAALGGVPVVASIEESDVAAMTDTIRRSGATTVVWAAGAGGGDPARTIAVDQDGAVRSMDAAAAAGVTQYLLISAVDTRDREAKPEPAWYDEDDRARSDKSWSAIGAYRRAKLAADRNLVTENARRKLDYTILRPGGLSQDPATGSIAAGKVHITPSISREDVARTVVEIIHQKAFHRTAYDIVGGDTPIAEAVAEMARTRTDTFEGYY